MEIIFEKTPEDDKILIGLDLFRQGGLDITEISPKKFEEERKMENENDFYSESDNIENIHSEKLKEEIKVNKSISPYSVCSLKSSIINLPTTSETICYTPQYPIKPQYKKIVDETLETCLKNKRISIAPEPWPPYNNALWAVPKNDENGNKTGVRVCNDIRILNQILTDEYFPIPSIESLLKNLKE